MNDTERKVLDAIDMDALLARLCDLIAIRSLSGDETPAQERMAELMHVAGMDVDVWQLDMERLRDHPAYTVEVERDNALGVVGVVGERDGPTLVLNGHVDVVPAGALDRWSRPPWEGTVESGRVYGRGSTDMKGGLCCALSAIDAIRKAGLAPRGSVLLQSVVGEEDGGVGTLAAIDRGHTGDAAVVLEPTELMISPAQAGALNFRITIPGRAAHGALRTEGVDPVEKFIPIFRAAREFERSRNESVQDPLFAAYDIPYPLCIGTVRAGVWASTVAETLTCEGRLGVAVVEDPERVRADFAWAIQAAADSDDWLAAHPPVLEWWGAQFEPTAIPADHTVVTTLAGSLHDATGQAATLRGMPYGADMRLLVNDGGTPTVLFGPGDVRSAHAPDEFVPIPDLEAVTRTVALMILRFCGVS